MEECEISFAGISERFFFRISVILRKKKLLWTTNLKVWEFKDVNKKCAAVSYSLDFLLYSSFHRYRILLNGLSLHTIIWISSRIRSNGSRKKNMRRNIFNNLWNFIIKEFVKNPELYEFFIGSILLKKKLHVNADEKGILHFSSCEFFYLEASFKICRHARKKNEIYMSFLRSMLQSVSFNVWYRVL